MKRISAIIYVLLFMLMGNDSYSLTDFDYTGIAFDGSGAIIVSQTVSVKIELIESGSVSYTETHTNITTNQFGTYTVKVGTGTTSDDLSGITASKNLKIKSTVTYGGSSGVWVVSSIMKPTVALVSGASSSYWNLGGNSGSIAGTDFIGTTDNADLYLEVQNSGSINNALILDNNQAIFRDGYTGTGFVNGNTRGQYSVDLQIGRSLASQVALGDFTFIGGGYSNTANGKLSTVSGGQDNVAEGDLSAVLGGIGNTAQSYGEVVGGLFATNYTPNSKTAFDANDRLFNIGNGTGDAARSDAFTIYKIGEVRIYGKLTLEDNLLPVGSGTQRIGLASYRWDWLHVEHARIYTDLAVNGVIVSDLNPETGVSHNLGSSTRRWSTVFVASAIRIGTNNSHEGYLDFDETTDDFTFDQDINVTGGITASANITANGNATLGNDATADVTTMNSALVTKYNSATGVTSAQTIPDGTMVYELVISSGSTGGYSITLPSGSDGQILYIHFDYNGSGNITINGTNYTADANITLVHSGGSWQTF